MTNTNTNTNTTPQQSLTVTFNGDGVVVGMPPGQAVPSWLTINAPSQSGSPVVVRLEASLTAVPANYTTTLRFVTGSSDGSRVVHRDVPVSFQLLEGRQVSFYPFGLATGSPVGINFNGAQQQYAGGQTSPVGMSLGVFAVGSNYTASFPAQPTGQNCTFRNGTSTTTDLVQSYLPLLPAYCNASLAAWTRAGGIIEQDVVPLYGLRGQPGAANTPGSRREVAHASDAAGNLWIFGGNDSNANRNDLWRFDVTSGQWTWISGSMQLNAAGSYGTLNVPAPGNMPGSRAAASAWFDADGNFWLFGGSAAAPATANFLNDLWMYDVAGDVWTWMGGSSGTAHAATGIYGATPATSNIPGGRKDAAVVKDASGDIWLFGGFGAGATTLTGRMNDLWRFSPATGEWEWMSGGSAPVSSRVQGSLGVPNAANYPNGRGRAALWIDTDGDLWMFGGLGLLDYENDLWRFAPDTRIWTWMGGTDRTSAATPPSRGTYLAPGTTDANYPASRGYAASWTDTSGDFWLFGGYGHGDGESDQPGHMNDLWRYSPATGRWSWLSGSRSQVSPAISGTQGVASVTNVPSGRRSVASWRDNAGRLWLWGGEQAIGLGMGTDFWYLVPP